ncbi:MAG: cell division protein FtsZ [Candidatus Puniceispirillum sp.]|nr:cell division protein FtsZ [Candidatus Puniceispirillum sp.]MBL6774246.1 cell division protein FtsZ [Candidatus Puniceispirillum sp.]
MTINLTVPQTMQELRPRITVVGVGGAGCNAVNNMINANLEGVDFLVANTDGQALAHSLSSRKIQLGSAITQGLGAGSKPEIGRAAAEESLQDVMAELADCNMVFITAGMGGGTGTGAAPVIARAARERGILTVGVITKPFEFEGQRRMKQAEDGIEELQAYVDTLIVIPNQNLFRLANERTTFADAFHMADAVLHQGVCGVTDLMIKPGQINLDFADIRAVMGEMGKAMMGTGEASGEARATQAAEAAINNPLLDDTTMKGANAVLINITGGLDMTLFEVDEAANRIRKEVDPDATIIFGSAFDDKLEGVMRVSVVATGISGISQSLHRPNVMPQRTQPSAARPSSAAPNGTAPSTIIPNPISSLLTATPAATFEAISSGMTDEAQNAGDTVSSSQLADTPADLLDDQLSNELAGAAIDEFISTDASHEQQMDINDAIGNAPAAAAIDAMVSAEASKENAPSGNDQMAPAMGDTQAMPLTTSDATTAPTQARFISAAAIAMPDEESVTQTVETPVMRPTSLINRISGLWSSKPVTKATEKIQKIQSEPSLEATATKDEVGVSILDLSRAETVSKGLERGPETAPKADEDDLDIPAFLRRQAN